MVGVPVGLYDGVVVGDSDGLMLGAVVGELVGAVGETEGESVGASVGGVGASVGDCDGPGLVGVDVGFKEGASVGFCVGEDVALIHAKLPVLNLVHRLAKVKSLAHLVETSHPVPIAWDRKSKHDLFVASIAKRLIHLHSVSLLILATIECV
jgi:hypothetical protein